MQSAQIILIPNSLSNEYCAMIIGGIGPDVWDKEIVFTASDFMDAAGLAQGKADELNGQVVSLDQTV